MSDAQLHMLRAELDQHSLFRFAAKSGLPLRLLDTGYLVHALLRALFDKAAPQPFVLHEHRASKVTLFGYSRTDHRELAERARALADPLALAALDLASLCSKLMPAAWRTGLAFRFESRVCPVVRVSGRARREDSREVDAFLHRCWREGEGAVIERESVYRDWLAAELNRGGAARLLEARMTRFRRNRLFRRDRGAAQPRPARCERPDVAMSGRLEVVDSGAFAALLRRGLGRHRAFGFGMLLLRH